MKHFYARHNILIVIIKKDTTAQRPVGLNAASRHLPLIYSNVNYNKLSLFHSIQIIHYWCHQVDNKIQTDNQLHRRN